MRTVFIKYLYLLGPNLPNIQSNDQTHHLDNTAPDLDFHPAVFMG